MRLLHPGCRPRARVPAARSGAGRALGADRARQGQERLDDRERLAGCSAWCVRAPVRPRCLASAFQGTSAGCSRLLDVAVRVVVLRHQEDFATRRHVPAGSRPARTHSESRPTGEVSSPGHPDRERQGRAGRGEEHHGADLRGGLLPRLVRLPTGEVRPRAIAHLKVLMRSRGGQRWKRDEKLPFQWAIEGDIKGCFDNISHHGLMERVR